MKKQLRLFTILLTIVLSIFIVPNQMLIRKVNATYVEKPIIQDTIWTLVDSPFIVSHDILVYSNATLTIEPGVEVKFGEGFSLIVSGKLYADGTSRTIKFTSNKERPLAGDWETVKFNGTLPSTLIGCFIAHAKNGIFAENANLEIRDSSVNLCSQNGILAINGKITVQNCNVTGCVQNGINATDAEFTIQNATVMNNEGNGISVTGNRQVDIQKSVIISNGNGILLTGTQISRVNIVQNKILGNNLNGIRFDAITHSNVLITNNTISTNNRGLYVSTMISTYIANNSVCYNTIGFSYDKGSHTAYYNDICNNDEVGMEVLFSATVNAEYNYWGDPSGPYHESLNPTGRGNRVGGNGINLDFLFFLTRPIWYVNTPPTAILFTDKILVAPNETVMFVATNSIDEGSINWYNFNFGDGNSSGWTTLSIFTHKYTAAGTYNAEVTVMDDFGATSISAVTVNVQQGFLPLIVNIGVSDQKVSEEENVLVTVYVTNGTHPSADSGITMFSVKGGQFTQSSGVTNATGYFVTTFTAPDVAKLGNVRIIARASKTGYTDGAGHQYLEVLPILSVQIVADRDVIKSEETVPVTIYVTSNNEPVTDAAVSITCDSGTVSLGTGTTDSSGIFSTVFIAPQTTSALKVNMTASAKKNDYMDGVGQGTITVEPKMLDVAITTDSVVTLSETKLNVVVQVQYEGVPVAEASVVVSAENGTFEVANELTDLYGNATFVFTTPPVSEQTNITITAQASKNAYAAGQRQLKITVNPRTFNIRIEAPAVESGGIASVTVNVTCNEDGDRAVAGALVIMSCSSGSFHNATGNYLVIKSSTNAQGLCTFDFAAPQTGEQISVIVAADLTKAGYIPGRNETTIIVTPKVGGEAWPLMTILLIIVPVVIVVIVVALIKLKVISISSEEEEE